jgi:hypothetical protein
MKFLIVPALVLLLIGSAEAWAAPRALEGFSGVAADGKFDVEIVLGDHYAVDVSGADANQIETSLERQSLRIHADNRRFGRYDALVRITAPRLAALSAAAGSSVRVASPMRAEGVALAAHSGGKLEVSGDCQTVAAEVSSGGEIEAADLNCAQATVSASSGGHAAVQAHHNITANASSGAEIVVHGRPEYNLTHKSSGAEISYVG